MQVWLAHLIIIASLFGSSLASAGTEICATENLPETTRSFSVASCALACSNFYDAKAPAQVSSFEKHCKEFDAQVRSGGRTYLEGMQVVGKFVARGAQCLPLSFAKAADGIMTDLPELVGEIIRGVESTTRERTLEWIEISKNPIAKRALARNLINYSAKTADGNYVMSDEEVDKKIEKMSVVDLQIRAGHDQEMLSRQCGRRLSDVRTNIARSGNVRSFELQQRSYDQLYESSPECVSILHLHRPHSESAQPKMTQEQCMKQHTPKVDCLSWAEQMVLGLSCQGQEYEEALNGTSLIICANFWQFIFAPSPRSVSKLLPAIRAATGVSGAAEKAEIVGTAARTTAREAAAEAGTVSRETRVPSTVARSRTEPVNDFVRNLNERVFVSAEQNQRFIHLAEASSADTSRMRFFDVENSVMKKLNDVSGDKNLVTSLTNYQKELLLKRIEELKAKYPKLTFDLYSDFKSVKIAVHGTESISAPASAELFKDLERIYGQTNLEFAQHMKTLDIKVPEAGDPSNWFKAGYGQSVDQASAAARRARQSDEVERLFDFNSGEVNVSLMQSLSSAEKSREAITASSKMAPLLSRAENGALLPSEDVFDLIRKYPSSKGLAQAVSSRYGLTGFTEADASLLQKYAKDIDEFSPTILIGKRENANLDRAVEGGVTADFLGMGAANARATAANIAGTREVDQALIAARAGERTVTETFRNRMHQFQKVVGGTVTCSGDDCVRIAEAALSYDEKTKMLAELAGNEHTRSVRMAFVGPGVPQNARMQIASHGEAIEKAFRKELEGNIPFAKLKQMTFGFDMQTTKLNEGMVDLIIGRARGLRLSAEEQAALQTGFGRALEKYNADLKNYSQGSARMQVYQFRFTPVPLPGHVRQNEDD